MASVASRSRLATSLARRCCAAHQNVSSRRAFSLTARNSAAQNYSMPALSPTMTEGNIATWRVKEGDSFSAGDVLLEIETDKATMDVEAQDDGVLFKIMQQDGAKGVKVGQRIAVLAESGDDLGSLEVPAEEKAAKKEDASKSEKEEGKEQSGGKGRSLETTSSNAPSPSKSASSASAPSSSSQQSSQQPQKQKYPLFPSVQQLLRENNLSASDADKITATGPGGRLLKGDVLAHLGKIPKEYPAESSARLQSLSHLDLSNIQVQPTSARQPEKENKHSKEAESAAAALPEETELALPISLSAVLATQKRVNKTLGTFLPLSVFIARASELANDDLPARKRKQPSQQELFDSVLGLDKVATHKTSRGNFVPQITGLPDVVAAPASSARQEKTDIIDLLAPKAVQKKKMQAAATVVQPVTGPNVAGGQNLFSVVARPGDEVRAMEYLERMKLALETEPGRLVL